MTNNKNIRSPKSWGCALIASSVGGGREEVYEQEY
jgi:hypothetical protein